MTNHTVTALVRESLKSVERRIGDLAAEANGHRECFQELTRKMDLLELEAKPLREFLQAHGELPSDQSLKLQNVLARVTWPGITEKPVE